MTNPTSNFNWQMPEPTDLVTNLPADFEVFGQAVDTDSADLLGGTTGQVLSKTSNTDLDFTWVNDASGMTNPMTTTGDIIYSSPGSTPVRLGIGSAAQVLTVASGVPSWATPAGGGGKLLQLQNTQITSTLSVSNSATPFTFVDVSGFTATITPTLNTSKVMFQANISGALCSSGGANRVYFRIMRGSTVIGVGDAGTGTQSSSGFFNTDGNAVLNNFLFWLDTPATTSATTYKIQVACNLANLTYNFNRPADTLITDSPLTASQITLMEIGA